MPGIHISGLDGDFLCRELGLSDEQLTELVQAANNQDGHSCSLAELMIQAGVSTERLGELRVAGGKGSSPLLDEAQEEARLASSAALGASIVGREARSRMMTARAKNQQIYQLLKSEEAEGMAPRKAEEADGGDEGVEQQLAQLKLKLKEDKERTCDVKNLYSSWKNSPRSDQNEDSTNHTSPQNLSNLKPNSVQYTSEEFMSKQWRSPVSSLLYEVRHTRASVQDQIEAATPKPQKLLNVERLLLINSSQEPNTKLLGTKVDRDSKPHCTLEMEHGLVHEAYHPYRDDMISSLSKEAELYEKSAARRTLQG